MRLLWELSKLSFQRHLTYRAAAVAGLLTNLFFGLLRAAVLVALYGARRKVVGISVPAAITYTGLSQAVIGFLSVFSWYEVMNSVYSGDIASELLKPLNYFTFWLAQDLGRAAAGLLMRGVTIMAAYALIFDITLPQSGGQWLALGIAVVLSWLVSFAWRFLVNLAAFWTPNALGVGRFFFIRCTSIRIGCAGFSPTSCRPSSSTTTRPSTSWTGQTRLTYRPSPTSWPPLRVSECWPWRWPSGALGFGTTKVRDRDLQS